MAPLFRPSLPSGHVIRSIQQADNDWIGFNESLFA